MFLPVGALSGIHSYELTVEAGQTSWISGRSCIPQFLWRGEYSLYAYGWGVGSQQNPTSVLEQKLLKFTCSETENIKPSLQPGLILLQPETLASLAGKYLYLRKESKLFQEFCYMAQKVKLMEIAHQVVLLLECSVYLINKRPRCVSPMRRPENIS